MNKFLILLNTVLIIVVIILLVLFFSKNKNASTQTLSKTTTNAANNNSTFKIGYFELDSIDNNYKYMQDVKDQLTAQDKGIESQINDLQNEVRNKINDFQKRGPTLSQAEQTQYNNEINNLGRTNQEKAQRLQQIMGVERDTKIRQVKQVIQKFLRTYAKNNGYNYIIGTIGDDNYYYKDSTQNITAELLNQLNKTYSDSLRNSKQ